MRAIIQLTTFLTFLLATLVSAAQYNMTGTEFYINKYTQGIEHHFINRDTDRITCSKFVDPCIDSAALGNFTYKTTCNSGGGYFLSCIGMVSHWIWGDASTRLWWMPILQNPWLL
jgi:hypothetical protein